MSDYLKKKNCSSFAQFSLWMPFVLGDQKLREGVGPGVGVVAFVVRPDLMVGMGLNMQICWIFNRPGSILAEIDSKNPSPSNVSNFSNS